MVQKKSKKTVFRVTNALILLFFITVLSFTACSAPPSETDSAQPYFVVVGNATDMGAYSKDGIVWEPKKMDTMMYQPRVCYGKDKFVTIGDTGTNQKHSIDGIEWDNGTFNTDGQWWNSICYGAGKFLVISHFGRIVYSDDGINDWVTNWDAMNTVSNISPWNSVCYGNRKFVAVGNGAGAYSIDGSGEWNEITALSSMSWNSVCYGNGKFVVIGNYNNEYGIAYHSIDGITWYKAEVMPDGMKNETAWRSVCYGNNRFVAVAGGHGMYSDKTVYSRDGGKTWSLGNGLPEANWLSVCYGNGTFVAVAGDPADSEDGNKAAYSRDGETWVPVTTFSGPGGVGNWQSIVHGGDARKVPQLFASLREKAGTLLAYITGWFSDKNLSVNM
ncbi:MAG: glycoside hydrolase [Leptospirales bacterium]|nr:glycoside hydrolase [Leptospirales bacterium]